MDPELAIPLLLLVGAVAYLAGRRRERRRHRAEWEAARVAGLADLRRINELAAMNNRLGRENEGLANELAAAVCPRGYWRRMRERSR